MLCVKKIITGLFLILTSVLLIAQKQPGNFHGWAPTPPMGWNSWDCYGPTVTEAEVKANADYMAKYLKNYGWKYIVVDIRWYVDNDKPHGYNEKDPQYSIDAWPVFTGCKPFSICCKWQGVQATGRLYS